MKFYKRDPDAALAGMSALNSAQRGIYNSIIDLLYSRDGMVPCLSNDDDRTIAKNISIDLREWRHIKAQLMQLGKIRITNDGLLTANGVQSRLAAAQLGSELARRSVTRRWDNYRLAKQFNAAAIQPRNTTNSYRQNNSEISTEPEKAKPPPVDDGDNDFGNPTKSTKTSVGTDSLKATLRDKGWI